MEVYRIRNGYIYWRQYDSNTEHGWKYTDIKIVQKVYNSEPIINTNYSIF